MCGIRVVSSEEWAKKFATHRLTPGPYFVSDVVNYEGVESGNKKWVAAYFIGKGCRLARHTL